MKKILLSLVLTGLVLTSCNQMTSESIESIVNPPVNEIKTVDYSAVFLDSSNGLTSYSTGTLELTEPMEYTFIAQKVVELSGKNVEINSITVTEGDATVDLCSEFFSSENNNALIEKSLLCSLDYSLKNNFKEINNVFFSLDGRDFMTAFHSFSKNEVFSSELLETVADTTPVEVTYTMNYYDIVEDAVKQFSETKIFYGKVDPIYFVEKLSDLTETDIGVNQIEVSDNGILVDFSSGACPVSETGSYEESHILNSISEVLLQVYPDVNGIYISADGKDYESGHIYILKETPYATRQNEKLG